MGKIIDKPSLIKEIDASLKRDLIPDYLVGYRYCLEGVYMAVINPSITSQELYTALANTYDVEAERVKKSLTSLFQGANRARKKADLPPIGFRKYIMQCSNKYYDLERFMIEVPDDNA